MYVNGVAQRAGADYRVENGALVFARAPPGGKARLLALDVDRLGVAGTYRQNDVVDVIYEAADGGRAVASGLPVAAD